MGAENLPKEISDAALRGWFNLPADDDLSLYDFSDEMRQAWNRAVWAALNAVLHMHTITESAAETADPRRSRRTRGLRARRIELWEKQGGRCWYCAKATVLDGDATLPYAATIDHKTPLARGGSNAEYNLVMACRKCNGDKGILTDREFRGGALRLVPAGAA